MAIHFKFRSAVEFDSIDIEGPFISVAALKEKIVEHKNLGRAIDFDLLITNAQTSEEYMDDSFLVPKNTSVTIKRVPTSHAKSILRSGELPKSHVADSASADNGSGIESRSRILAFSDAGIDGSDDFGVDLYAIPEPVPTSSRMDVDENIRISAMVNSTASDWQRQTQEGYAGGRCSGRGSYGRGILARGRGFGRATPPQGYVCHRCGQAGHFIQHCPTNGDPTYDMRKMKPPVGIPKTRLRADQEGSYILPDGSVAVMQPDEMVFAKEADALLAIRPILLEPPLELKCPLCGNIFKDAVMIPCCQYSFCDKCIREELIAKGKCTQCDSSKFKNDDLLPNINLRQAIDRFLETQISTSGASDSFYRQQLSDVDFCPRRVATPAASRLQIELRKPTSLAGGGAKVLHAKDLEVVEVVEVMKGSKEEREGQAEASVVAMSGGEDIGGVIRGPPSKDHEAEAVEKEEITVFVKDDVKLGFLNDEGKSGMGNNKKPQTSTVMETAEGLAVESEVSKGKKKKKRTRPSPADGVADTSGGGKFRKLQGERGCYICGSPEHFARDCIDYGGPGPYGVPPSGMFASGMLPPMGVAPYGGGFNMEWHVPPMHPHAGPFGYSEAMHGPGAGPMTYEGPLAAGPGYGIPPFGMPPLYPGGLYHGGYMRTGLGMMGAMDRPPLTREEFLEVQGRQRQERHREHRVLERDGRALSPDGPHQWEMDRNAWQRTSEMEMSRQKESREKCGDISHYLRKTDFDLKSAPDYSDDTDYCKANSERLDRNRGPKSVALDSRYSRRWSNLSKDDDDVTSIDELRSCQLPLHGSQDGTPHKSRQDRENSRQHRMYLEESSQHEPQFLQGDPGMEGCVSPNWPRMESSSKRVSVSGEARFASTKRNFQEAPDPYDYHLLETLDLRTKLGRKHEKDRHESRHNEHKNEVGMNNNYEESERRNYKREHRPYKSQGEEATQYDSEYLKRKKRKHRKQHDDMVGRIGDAEDTEFDSTIDLRKTNSKRTLHLKSSSIEVTRWQLIGSELDGAHSSHTYHSKRKN